MRLAICLTAALLLAAPACAQDPHADARPISWQNLLDRERAPADARIEYGEGEEQYGELWLPDGDGPFPLVIMIHGGCWQAAIPGTILQDQLNADLKDRGIAVWNITYPRLGHETGGYPGTFESVAWGVDYARQLTRDYPIDPRRTVLMGHSAGGHLALWAAARGQLQDTPLYVEDPFIPNGVITLAGINDLELYRAEGPGRCGEPDTVDALIAGHPGDTPYADTSPDQLLPMHVEQVIMSGDLDPIVPPLFGAAYAAEAEAAGDTVTEITLENAGHFELIDPTAPAWAVILGEVERLLGE
ncbi:alpha/beta hydrolase family protein [Oceanicaulis sp. LC35]|uniref:alpha/beta hydrolase family protein n=1 Tax=Oceanicaulis sp. LC35 TaxID=3349635 RepID=UPI003F87BB9D